MTYLPLLHLLSGVERANTETPETHANNPPKPVPCTTMHLFTFKSSHFTDYCLYIAIIVIVIRFLYVAFTPRKNTNIGKPLHCRLESSLKFRGYFTGTLNSAGKPTLGLDSS